MYSLSLRLHVSHTQDLHTLCILSSVFQDASKETMKSEANINNRTAMNFQFNDVAFFSAHQRDKTRDQQFIMSRTQPKAEREVRQCWRTTKKQRSDTHRAS